MGATKSTDQTLTKQSPWSFFVCCHFGHTLPFFENLQSLISLRIILSVGPTSSSSFISSTSSIRVRSRMQRDDSHYTLIHPHFDHLHRSSLLYAFYAEASAFLFHKSHLRMPNRQANCSRRQPNIFSVSASFYYVAVNGELMNHWPDVWTV